MDTSPEYIKMCDCEEIQALHKGQAYHNEGDWFAIYHEGMIEYFKDRISPSNVHPNVRVMSDTGWSHDKYEECCNTTWLPTQSDLQKMVERDTLYQSLATFVTWAFGSDDIHAFSTDNWSKFASMEQLWLAFCMAENHNKVWADGWVTSVR